MESFKNPDSINERLKQTIINLNPEDPEDKDIIDGLEAAGQECREGFPTIELAVDAYRQGVISYAWLCLGYPEEEIKKILDTF